MHQLLTKGVNFDAIPFQFPGWYIKGITWQIYEALLQTISTCIQLYCETNTGTYNARAVSTLANESFFADLIRYDKESHGYQKGTNVSRVFGCIVLLNHFKHKRDKKITSFPPPLNLSMKSNWLKNVTSSWYAKICSTTTEFTEITSLISPTFYVNESSVTI